MSDLTDSADKRRMSEEDQWKDRLADGIEIDDSLLFDDNEGSGASQERLFANIPDTLTQFLLNDLH